MKCVNCGKENVSVRLRNETELKFPLCESCAEEFELSDADIELKQAEAELIRAKTEYYRRRKS
jgi:protein-arginine kinase activator protein McsA